MTGGSRVDAVGFYYNRASNRIHSRSQIDDKLAITRDMCLSLPVIPELCLGAKGSRVCHQVDLQMTKVQNPVMGHIE